MDTSSMVGLTVGYLAEKLKKNESVKSFFNDFIGATVDWIRPIFLKDDETPSDITKQLAEKPDSKIMRQQVEIALAAHLENNPKDLNELKKVYEQIVNMSSSNLDIKKLVAVHDIEVDIDQENSAAKIEDLTSTEGKIRIDIKQK